MKRSKYLLAGVFLLIEGVSAAQRINFSKEFLKSASYSNQAELAICRNDLKKAVLYYDSVFMSTKKPFSRDIFNDALCEKKLGNDSVADSLFKSLYMEGFMMRDLGKCFDTARYYELKKREIAKYTQLYNETIEILREDQSADATRYQDMQKFLDTVLTNAQRIMNLTQNAEQDSLKLFSINNSVLYTPIVHFFQLWRNSKGSPKLFERWPMLSCLKKADFKKYGFDKFLIEQTKKGNLDRYALAQLYSILGVNMGFNVVLQLNNYVVIYYPDSLGKEMLNEIDSTRREFGLESYEDYFTKVRYTDSLVNNDKPFKAVNQEGIGSMNDRMHDSCNFILVGHYRTKMGFKSDKEAWDAYQNIMKELKK